MAKRAWVAVVTVALLALASGCGTGAEKSGGTVTPSSSGMTTSAAATPTSGATAGSEATSAAGARLAVLTADNAGPLEQQSTPFALHAGDPLRVRYAITRGSGPVHPTVIIRLSTWSQSPVDVASLNLDKAGKGYGPPWTVVDDGKYTVAVQSVNAKYRVTVSSK
jgi:hypothetical protein